MMYSLKGNPKIIQFLQKNKPPMLPPQIQIPDPEVGDAQTVHSPPQDLSPVLGDSFSEPMHTADVTALGTPDLAPSQPDAHLSDTTPSIIKTKKKAKNTSAINPLPYPNTRKRKRNNSNNPIDRAISAELPPSEGEEDVEMLEEPHIHYEVEKILDFKRDEQVCLYSAHWPFGSFDISY